MELANGYEQTTTALTDAIKSRCGFSHLFTFRASDLVSDAFDVRDMSGDILELVNYNPEKYVLVLGIFVGHPATEFAVIMPGVEFISFNSANFQIVICYHFWEMPSLPFSWIMTSLTLNPDLFDDDGAKYSLYKKLSGKNPQQCIDIFISLSKELKDNLIQTYQSLIEDKL
jgi:hypothetical protein